MVGGGGVVVVVGFHIYNSWMFDDDEWKMPAIILENFENHLEPKTIRVIVFINKQEMRRESGESVDNLSHE